MALAFVVSLRVGPFRAGISYGVVMRLERDVIALQAELKAFAAVQHTQELKLVTLGSELRAFREGVVEIKAALRKLAEKPGASRARP
ncbi:hypothetical protein [Hyalangium versicolor]|uniref:hypothetical protein n=1 Tax=Hyalangium versicolor TaxID=2861190 RepID=UPI001CCC6E24|nr:hypothetical protein [Hyalangium versicolor]